jgi:SPP1 gp7 family putative phage head morphogenesis protein
MDGIPSGTQTLVDTGALRRSLFARKLPWAELYRTYYGASLDLQRIEAALLMAADGVMVDITDLGREQLRLDPHVNAVAGKRFGALHGVPCSVTPAKGPDRDKRIAQAIADDFRAALDRIVGLRQAIYDLAWGFFDARAALEIDWQWVGGKRPYQPAALDWIHPRRLGFGGQRELRVVETFLRTGFFSPLGMPLSDIPGKFIWMTPRRFADYPELEGLNPRTIYWSYFKRFGAKMRMVLTELFALPWRTLEADKDAPVQKEDMDEAVMVAEALGSETTAGFPAGIRLKVHSQGEQRGEMMADTIDQVDSQISRMWLGNEATTVAKGDALGGKMTEVQKGEQNIFLDQDGEDISARLTKQLAETYVLLNYGPDWLPYTPSVSLQTKPIPDRTAAQKRLNDAISIGVPVGLAHYYEETGIVPPEDDEAVIVLVERPLGVSGLPRAKIVDPNKETNADEDNAEAPPPETAWADQVDDDEEDPPLAAGRILLGAHPDVGHGSPSELVDRGTVRGARHTTGWAALFCEAVDGLSRETSIYAKINATAKVIPLAPFGLDVERSLVRGLMMGGLDAALEGETEGEDIGAIAAEAVRLLEVEQKGEANWIRKPFLEAISFFLKKKVMVRSEFDRLRAEAKRRAFTVAGLARDQMVQTAHDALGAAIQGGKDLRSFAKDLGARFDSAGFTKLNPSHVELVFRNGVMGAYASGRDAQMRQPEVTKLRPYWQILGVNDDRTRPHHKAAHKLVLRFDDPFWTRAPLPWGHNCRCRKTSRGEKDLQRLGLKVVTGAALLNLPDKGWDKSSLLV